MYNVLRRAPRAPSWRRPLLVPSLYWQVLGCPLPWQYGLMATPAPGCRSFSHVCVCLLLLLFIIYSVVFFYSEVLGKFSPGGVVCAGRVMGICFCFCDSRFSPWFMRVLGDTIGQVDEIDYWNTSGFFSHALFYIPTDIWHKIAAKCFCMVGKLLGILFHVISPVAWTTVSYQNITV